MANVNVLSGWQSFEFLVIINIDITKWYYNASLPSPCQFKFDQILILV